MVVIRRSLILFVTITACFVTSVHAEELLIIGNPSIDLAAPLSLREIAAIYLLRTTTWPDGSRIVPVNREVASGPRSKFNAAVLGLDNANLAAYWNGMHFQGKLPPVLQESEPAMLAFVQRVPGAVGYISAATAPQGVKVLSRVP